MIAIKPGLKVFNRRAFKGSIVSIDEEDVYNGEKLTSAYCSIKFESGDIFTDMYVMQGDIIKE